MIRNVWLPVIRKYSTQALPKQKFLSNDYKCVDAWNSQTSSSILNKVNLNDFYNVINQNYTTKGVISAIDVDIFANAVKDPLYLDDLKDLLHKLRLSGDTQNTLDSTHHATIRKYLEFGNLENLINMLKEPLTYGLFLDFFTANMVLDELIASEKYELAARVSSLVMLQEDYSHDITNALCKYACYKYITEIPKKDETPPPPDPKIKIEEIKIRIKYLRNPYFDDHFDITNLHHLSGKSLAWMADIHNDNLNNNLKIIGWLFYQKYDKLESAVQYLCKESSFKIYNEVLLLFEKEYNREEFPGEKKDNNILQNCIKLLKTASISKDKLEESLRKDIENAINKLHKNDILMQNQLFKTWINVRDEKLKEQARQLDRIKRIKEIEEKQKNLQVEEQKLWFFENEEKIDLEIEEKEEDNKTEDAKKSVDEKSDEDYVPPEIRPKRRS